MWPFRCKKCQRLDDMAKLCGEAAKRIMELSANLDLAIKYAQAWQAIAQKLEEQRKLVELVKDLPRTGEPS